MNPSQQPKETFSSEKADILKASAASKSNQFANAGNNVFARTQSTPLEDQKPSGAGGFLKAKLAQKKAGAITEFKPSADSGAVANDFLKSTTKLSSNAQSFTPTSFVPKTTTTTTPATSSTVTTTPATTGTTTTGAPEKKKLKLSSSSFPFNAGGSSSASTDFKPAAVKPAEKTDKLNLTAEKIGKPTPKKGQLEEITEKNEENKKETTTSLDAQAKPFIKPQQGFEPPKPSNEFQEVKAKTRGPKVDTKNDVQKTQPIQSPGFKYESPKKQEAKPEVVEQKVEPVVSAKKEVKIEIVIMSRDEFASAVDKLIVSLKDRRLPENLIPYQNRDVIAEVQKGKGRTGGGGGQYDHKSGGSTFDRSDRQKVEPPKEKAEDGGFQRGTGMKQATPAEPKAVFARIGLTPEELEMKKKLSENVNVWTSAMKGEKDPAETFRKEAKFNLNIITIDNFDVIKRKILELASQKFDNCKKVAELIIENAWTQKRYVNTYAKLCKYLGEQDSLNFDEIKDAKKKKNDFTLQILKQIQNVFEDESAASVGMKKPVEEMTDEEKTLFLAKKKQKIFGNVSFIGELYLEKVIVIGVVRIITSSLLNRYLHEYDTYKKSTEVNPNKFYEDTLEGLLKFYEIIGRTIEEKENSQKEGKGKKKEKAEKPSNIEANFQKVIKAINAGTKSEDLPKLGDDEISLEGLFKILNIVLAETGLTPRLDSLVKNLMYRRDNNWQDSLAKDQGPKTMKELHDEYQREQMEAERSGAQYKEELRYSQPSKSNKVYTPKNEYQFQVAESKERRDDRREIENLDDVDTSKYSFKPDRSSKKDTQDTKGKPKVNYELIKGDLKDIYKLTNGEEVEEKKDAIEELQKMGDKYEAKDIMISFLKTFYDGSLAAISKRFVVSSWLFEKKPQAVSEFPTLLTNALNDLFRELSDFPNLPKYLARLALDYCRIQKNGDILKKITVSDAIAKSEEAYDLVDMFEKFHDQLGSYLNGDYNDLKNIITEDILKDFEKKYQIEGL